ncbi:hypothetical protein Mal15_46540 [Stieleria maiorica]|uniref:DUF4154 domain-containing protein n=1 Tax=Stieleria maiorica TaxID=2795974 RepID=A0A5B9MH22_9BACT|nr:YfiR family protein [Stieleria maiorica]QEG00583.1 hypothetical protein Mal15_46540 [Stieleria maiorica]
MRRILSSLCLVLCFTALTPSPTVDAQQAVRNLEFDMKAGYFVYFGGLIKWPDRPFPGAANAFVIGVLGDNPFGPSLRPSGNGFAVHSSLIGKPVSTIQNKPIKVVHYKSVAEFEKNYSPCHILFISRSSEAGVSRETVQDRANSAIQKTKGQSVLLVGEADGKSESETLANSGVMICYWNDLQAFRLKMFINKTVAQNERLNISSRLLGLKLVTVL